MTQSLVIKVKVLLSLYSQKLSKVQNKLVELSCRSQNSVSNSGICVLISVARGYFLDSNLFLKIQPFFIVTNRFKRTTI